MEKLDLALAFIKAVGICSAAIFSVFGIVHDFKDGAGRITRWGKIAVCGAAVSAILSMVVHSVEILKAKGDAAKSEQRTLTEVARTNTLLLEVRRSLERVDLSQIQVEIGMFVSIDDPALDGYKRRLEERTTDLGKRLEGSGKNLLQLRDERLEVLRMKRENVFSEIVTIYPGSSLWPDPAKPTEVDAAELLNQIALTLEVKSPRYSDPRDSLLMVLAGRIDGRPAHGGVEVQGAKLIYDKLRRRLSVHVKGLANQSPEKPSEVFLSVVDFDGSDVAVELVVAKEVTQKAPSLSLGEFRMNFGRNLRSLQALDQAPKETTADGGVRFRVRLSYRSEIKRAGESG